MTLHSHLRIISENSKVLCKVITTRHGSGSAHKFRLARQKFFISAGVQAGGHGRYWLASDRRRAQQVARMHTPSDAGIDMDRSHLVGVSQ
jgi:hypothetical protein